MTIQYHIKHIENLLNKEKITKYNLLQTSFDISCLKFELSNGDKYIAKYYINKKKSFNAISAEANNLKFLNQKFNFFPKIIKFNRSYLIIKYIENDKDYPNTTNEDLFLTDAEKTSLLEKGYTEEQLDAQGAIDHRKGS